MKHATLFLVLFAISLAFGCGCVNQVEARTRTSGSPQKGTGPAKAEELDHYATIDIADSVPSDFAKSQGPFRIVMESPVDYFALGEPVFFLTRDDPEYDPSNESHRKITELADVIRRAAKEKIAGADCIPGMTDMVLLCRDLAATGCNNGNRNFSMSKKASTNADLASYAEVMGLSIESGSKVSDLFNANNFAQYVKKRHPDMFPAHGRGKLLRLQTVHGTSFKSADPARPYFHTEWALYLVGGKAPLPKVQYVAIPAHYDGELFKSVCECVHRDPVTGNLVLNDGKDVLPLFETQFPETVAMDRLDAALIQLLNGLSETDFAELEEVSW